jgi:hypothetical protein
MLPIFIHIVLTICIKVGNILANNLYSPHQNGKTGRYTGHILHIIMHVHIEKGPD